MTIGIGETAIHMALGSAAIASPLAARAQPPMPVMFSCIRLVPYTQFVDAFRQGLDETGFVEGQNVAMDALGGRGFQALATELVMIRWR